MNVLTRIKVDPETGCHLWTGTRSTYGYGTIDAPGYRAVGSRRILVAHRVMWEMAHGFTDAEHVHHKCENPPCVNPDHLQPMTHQENNRLAYTTFKYGTCERGHTNLGVKPSGGHYCRTCNAERMRSVREREGVVARGTRN